jgi:tRNA threonylcarbamoyladenosine biosynthesis protein TsaB
MPSFRDISAHFPALVLDAASAVIQVGCVRSQDDATWCTSTAESGVGVFQSIEQLGVNPADVASFVYCEGPGSILGVRTVAMAIRTWCVLQPRPVFAYLSLALVGHALGREDLNVVADARRDSWHQFNLLRGLQRVPASDLTGHITTPDGFRSWSPLPAATSVTPYGVAQLIPKVWDRAILQLVEGPDAFLHEEPSYVLWQPRVHQAPVR